MRDWRGNEYGHEFLWRGSEPEMCEWPECDAQAVQNRCNAEGSSWRTHHHGGIHRLGEAKGFFFCAVHGEIVLSENNEITNATAARKEMKKLGLDFLVVRKDDDK